MNSQAEQPSLVLTRHLDDGTLEWVPIEIPERIPAEAGGSYALIDRAEYEAPQPLVARRLGDDLVIEVQGVEVLVLEGFFVTDGVAFHPTTDVAGGGGPFSGPPVTPETPALAGDLAGEQVVWAAGDGAVPPSGEDARVAADNEDDQPAATGGGGSPALWGGLAAGGLGLLALAGGGGGSGDGDDGGTVGGGGAGGGTPPPTQKTVSGSVVVGPVIDGNGLSVELFRSDGTSRLGEAKVGADGSFSIDVGNYSGVVIARVVDAGPGEDYQDEASDQTNDLNAELGAVQIVGDGDATVTVNVNPVTTLAASLAQRAAGDDVPTTAQVREINAAVAELFGLSDLHGIAVEPVNGDAYDGSDGISAAESYGALLAAFSGATLDNGGDGQQTIDDVLAGITLADGRAELSETAQALLLGGARTAETRTGESLSGIVASAVDTLAPRFTSSADADSLAENTGAGQVVYTAAASDATVVTYALAAVDDHEAFGIDPETGEVTLTANPDFEGQSSYSFTVVATDAAGNRSEQAVSLDIENLDDSAPLITSGATTTIDENSGSGRVVYTATATDAGPVTWGLAEGGDAAEFAIDGDTGEVRLVDDPDFETKSGYEFTVVAIDAEGNRAEQTVDLSVTNLDEVAPTITSGDTAAAIEENSGAGQTVYTATADDDGDVSGGVTFSLAAVDDHQAFSIDPESGAVTLNRNPNFEAQASFEFTVVASDAAGNSSRQAVLLPVTDRDDTAPVITSGSSASAIDENSGAGQVVYTAAATDAGPVSWRLADEADAAAFEIDPDTGAVRLTIDPDFETQSSYGFTVVATDAVGNSAERTVTLPITNVDEVAPSITSAETAEPIEENSGSGQVVYLAVADDSADVSGGVTFSLAPVDDHTDFSIEAATGIVRLETDPDFESQSSYSFTVVATDAAGNRTEQAVTLAINDIADETGPSVVGVALTSASGAQDGRLNAGDTVRVTVTMNDDTDVDTSDGTPRIALSLGGSSVFAEYASGSGTELLVFEYVVQAGDSDSDGISVPADGLETNGGALTDAAGNPADLSHGGVEDDAAFRVDTAAPTLSSSTPADGAGAVETGASIELTFSEDVRAGNGNIVIRDDAGDQRVIDVTDTSQVAISGSRVTVDPATDLDPDRTYSVGIDDGALVDAAGNPYGGGTLTFETATGQDTSLVVFDLVQGVSSDHSGRTFQSDVGYDIYIRVDSEDAALETDGNAAATWGTWAGATDLGSDDRIILVGSGEPVEGPFEGDVDDVSANPVSIAWQTSVAGLDAARLDLGTFIRATGFDDDESERALLFATSPAALFLVNQGAQIETMYLTNMPGGILTSQGLV